MISLFIGERIHIGKAEMAGDRRMHLIDVQRPFGAWPGATVNETRLPLRSVPAHVLCDRRTGETELSCHLGPRPARFDLLNQPKTGYTGEFSVTVPFHSLTTSMGTTTGWRV